MKGQVSIEFLSLMVIALLASALLVTALQDRAVEFNRASPYAEAQKIAQKVAYKIEYVKTENTAVEMDFPPQLEEEYNITVLSGQVVVSFDTGSSSFPARYSGDPIYLKSAESYTVEYSGGDLNVTS